MGIDDTRREEGYKRLDYIVLAGSMPAFLVGVDSQIPGMHCDLVMYLQLQVIIIGRKRRGTPLMSRS